ncbi:MAG: TetR/AcrR family transcriptional regulator [Candidatus Methanomethylophilaceae archaeon]|nr:TetR/AcrR family transcriptional regulator [Candidatus Methanomethylophilaceae archaeon]
MNDRRNEIVFATLELAAENGLGSVSMQQIANKIGITKASLYNHFSSRDEIVEAMYETIRQASKQKVVRTNIDYDALAKSGTFYEVIMKAVSSYRAIVQEPQMFLFYKLIMAERSINPAAAEIMVKETKTMIDATKALFRSLEANEKAEFMDLDLAAFSFSMAIHSIIDYGFDLENAGVGSNDDMLNGYIEEFCRLYGRKGV